jgi:hypothetical protein
VDEGVDYITSNSQFSDLPLGSTTLALKVVNDAGAASVLIDRGYFAQAAAIIRGVTEASILFLHFAAEPSRAIEWERLSGKERHSEFSSSKLKNRISSRAKFDWMYDKFGLFSEYGGHPSGAIIIAHHDGAGIQRGAHVNISNYWMHYAELAIIVWHAVDSIGDYWISVVGVDFEQALPISHSAYMEAWGDLDVAYKRGLPSRLKEMQREATSQGRPSGQARG